MSSNLSRAPAEVMDEKPIGEDPHMQEQQRNSGEADMCSQLEEGVQGAQLASQQDQLQGRECVQRVPVGGHGQDQFYGTGEG